MIQEVSVIYNVAAGGLNPSVQDIKQAFLLHNCQATIFLVEPGTRSVADCLRLALVDRPSVLVACGGDGTVSAVAAVAAQRQITLGILPLGTLNHLAKDLQLPLTLHEAAGIIAKGRRVSIDLGEVNGQLFVNNAGIGLYPKLVKFREYHQRQGFTKWAALVRALVSIWNNKNLVGVSMTVAGENIFLRSPLLFVGNNRYDLQGIFGASRVSLEQGVLQVCVLTATTKFQLLRAAWSLLQGKASQHLIIFETATFGIQSGKTALPVALDGEVVMLKTPLTFCIKPKALSVIIY